MKIVIYVVCIFLAVLSVLPFWIMIVNATRSTTEIQQHAISLIPSSYMMNNVKILLGKSFNPAVGFANSLIISICAGGLQLETEKRLFQLYHGRYDDSGAGDHDRFLSDGL